MQSQVVVGIHLSLTLFMSVAVGTVITDCDILPSFFITMTMV